MHGKFLRYDTSGAFTSVGSWQTFDLQNMGTQVVGYQGAVCMPTGVLLVPYHNGFAYHNIHVFYDSSCKL